MAQLACSVPQAGFFTAPSAGRPQAGESRAAATPAYSPQQNCLPGLQSSDRLRLGRDAGRSGWQRATASCRCAAVGVQMAETPTMTNGPMVGPIDYNNIIKGCSARAIKTFSMAELEARKLKYPATGTEALLMGLLTEGTSKAARFLRSKGITLYAVRREAVSIMGKSDMYFFSPEHPPITVETRNALEAARSYFNDFAGGKGEMTTEHMLLGLLDQKESVAVQILTKLDFNDREGAEKLARESGAAPR